MKKQLQTMDPQNIPGLTVSANLWQRKVTGSSTQRLPREFTDQPVNDGSAKLRFGHDFSRIQVSANIMPTIQARLPVSNPGDACEQEADRIAEQVTRSPEPVAVEGMAGKESDTVQAASGIFSHLQGGRPLPSATRAFFEPLFGYDFGHVKIHINDSAKSVAKALNARAFTLGHHIGFGVGQYAPATSKGQQLLAHELTHVVQQKGQFNKIYRAPQESAKGGPVASEPRPQGWKLIFNGSSIKVLDKKGQKIRVRLFWDDAHRSLYQPQMRCFRF